MTNIDLEFWAGEFDTCVPDENKLLYEGRNYNSDAEKCICDYTERLFEVDEFFVGFEISVDGIKHTVSLIHIDSIRDFINELEAFLEGSINETPSRRNYEFRLGEGTKYISYPTSYDTICFVCNSELDIVEGDEDYVRFRGEGHIFHRKCIDEFTEQLVDCVNSNIEGAF